MNDFILFSLLHTSLSFSVLHISVSPSTLLFSLACSTAVANCQQCALVGESVSCTACAATFYPKELAGVQGGECSCMYYITDYHNRSK